MSSNTYKSHPWLKELALDETKWFTPAFSKFPSVIAHEYHRMLEMCHSEEPFGLLLQTKDLLECVLKYQVLCICAWAKEMKVPSFEEKVAIEITSESLSLGAWKNFAGKIRGFFNKSDFELPEPMKNGLETLLSFYEDYGIVTWRNEKIGHGALGYTEDDDFRSDICQKLQDINTLFQKIFIDLKKQVICLEGKALFGYHNARDLEPKEGQLSIDCTGTVFCVEPYMILRNGNIFFFDNQKRSVTSQMQCYPNGRRINESNEYFRNLRRLLDKKGIDGKTGIDSEYMTNLEEEYLQHLTLEDHFVEPTFITDWLKRCLSQHDKGVFLLKMCRGTGKSTYAEKLNGLNNKPLVLVDDLEVRTFHIQRSQELSVTEFERCIENRWAQCFDSKRDWENPPRMMGYRLEDKLTPQQALAKFLEKTCGFYQRRYDREKILFVIDGLDEINNNEIWSYLPTSDILAEGVYVLLMSRDPEQEELPQVFHEKLDTLVIDDELTILASAEANVTFLRSYIKENQLVGIKKADIQRLFELADYRVLYLGMLCKLLRDGVSIEQFSDANNIVQRYLDVLMNSYGGKFAVLVQEILVFLSTWGVCEPLSLREIACVLGDGQITLELVGIMNDLMPLLKVQRGYNFRELLVGKNRFCVRNDDLAESLRKNISNVKEIVLQLINDAFTLYSDCADTNELVIDAECDVERDYELLVCTYALECLQMLRIPFTDVSKIPSPRVRKMDLEADTPPHPLGIKRYLKYGDIMTLFLVAKEGAIFNCAVGKLKLFIGRRSDAAEAFFERGEMKECWGNNRSAKRYYQKAVYVWEQLAYEEKPINKEKFASAYNNLAIVQYRTNEYYDAKLNYQRAIAVLEELEREVGLTNRGSLALAYYGLSVTLSKMDDCNEAIKYFERSKSIERNLSYQDKCDLAISYHDLAYVLGDNNMHADAISYYRKAIAIREQLFSEGKFPNRDSLAVSYHNLAYSLNKVGKHSDAIVYCQKAIAIREQLQKQGKLPNKSSLANSCSFLASVYHSLDSNEDALLYLERAIPLYEKLLQDGELKKESKLQECYDQMGTVLDALNRKDEAEYYRQKAHQLAEDSNTAS